MACFQPVIATVHVLFIITTPMGWCLDVSQAVSKGSWVTVQNPQLCPELTWRLELTNRSCGSVDANSKFRLWCVMDVTTTLSANVLRYATKFAYERLCGVRAVVLNLYKSALARNSDFLTCCTRGNEFRRLFFALCICHSILRERVSYGSYESSVRRCLTQTNVVL